MSQENLNEEAGAAKVARDQERMIEAILFAVKEPITINELKSRIPDAENIRETLKILKKKYENRGVNVVRVGDGWAFRTAKDLGFLMEKESFETRKLSRAATETLAIIAYHQPITRIEIEEIRGVSVSRGTIDQLVELAWVKFGRRRMSPGRPVTYVITETFLDHFGMENVTDLPDLKELRASGLLDSKPPSTEIEEVNNNSDEFENQSEFFDE
ncbi:MAG: SMC-Scp complex subunit ScpB [Paracoccaceae bacterium]